MAYLQSFFCFMIYFYFYSVSFVIRTGLLWLGGTGGNRKITITIDVVIVIFDLFYGKWISYRLLILRLFCQTPHYV